MALLLPRDGSIVIIDDEYLQAKPLIDLLTKNGYPSIYFNGDLTLCPDGLKKVRVIFADIQLLPALTANLYADLIVEHLRKLILTTNGPYVLIVWSAKLDHYYKTLEERLKAPDFNEKPIAIIKLDKNDYFKESEDENDLDKEELLQLLDTRFSPNDKDFIIQSITASLPQKGKREIKNDALEYISAKVKRGLKDYKAFEWLIRWEEIINESASGFVSDLSNIYKLDETWDFNFRNIIARLAYAQLGEQIPRIKKAEFIRSAFKTLNSALADSIDRLASEKISISDKDLEKFRESGYSMTENNVKYKVIWKEYSKYQLLIDDERKGDDKSLISDLVKIPNDNKHKTNVQKMIDTYNGVSPQLNSRLNIDTITRKPFQPGILYEVKLKSKKRKRALLDDTYFQKKKFTEKTNGELVVPDLELDKVRFVELEISPNCDFAQNKWKKHRVISGILFPDGLRATHKLEFQKSDSLYTAIPSVKLDGVVYKLAFSFMLLKSFDLTASSGKMKRVLFRVKNEPLADIITRMTSHASRIGLIEFL